MGAITEVGKYGVGLAFLANTFTGTLTIDNVQKFAEGFGIDADFLKDGKIQGLIDGKEGPLSLMISSLLLLPSGTKKYGVIAALGWLGVELYKAAQKGELTNMANQAFDAVGIENPLAPKAGADAKTGGLTTQQRAAIVSQFSGSNYVTTRAKQAIEEMAYRDGAVTQGVDGVREIMAAELDLEGLALDDLDDPTLEIA